MKSLFPLFEGCFSGKGNKLENTKHIQIVGAYFEYVKKFAQHVIVNFITFVMDKDLPEYFFHTPIEKIIVNFYEIKDMLLSALKVK